MRQQKINWEHTRMIAYMTYLSIPEGKNTKKKTIDQWWSLDGEVKENKDWQREALLIARKQAVEEAKQKKLNG